MEISALNSGSNGRQKVWKKVDKELGKVHQKVRKGGGEVSKRFVKNVGKRSQSRRRRRPNVGPTLSTLGR